MSTSSTTSPATPRGETTRIAEILPSPGSGSRFIEYCLALGEPGERAEEAHRCYRWDIPEEVRIDVLDHGDSAWREPSPAPRGTEPPDPGVRSVDLPLQETLAFQAAHHLRGHL